MMHQEFDMRRLALCSFVAVALVACSKSEQADLDTTAPPPAADPAAAEPGAAEPAASEAPAMEQSAEPAAAVDAAQMQQDLQQIPSFLQNQEYDQAIENLAVLNVSDLEGIAKVPEFVGSG